MNILYLLLNEKSISINITDSHSICIKESQVGILRRNIFNIALKCTY